jgi:Cu-Zn family superoxide dismutase
MRTTRSLAVAAGAALALSAAAVAPALANPPGPVRADGPTHVHDASYEGVTTRVQAVPTGNGTTIVTLDVRSLPAAAQGRTLGAHVHTGSCAADPLASGGHYQHPSPPAGTPLAAREIWLDLDVNAAGHGHAQAVAGWPIAAGTAGSVVVHALPTDPVTGAAGARLFCTTVAFGT